MIVVIATLRIRLGGGDALISAYSACRAETLKEPGCLGYDLHRAVEAPETFVFVERWARREDLSTHARSAHLKAYRAETEGVVLSRRVEIIHPERIEVHDL